MKFISVREKNCIKKFISNRTEIIHHVLIYYNILNYKIKNNITEKFASNNMKLLKLKGTLKKPFSASFDIVFILSLKLEINIKTCKHKFEFIFLCDL